jgi:hypothetical protein
VFASNLLVAQSNLQAAFVGQAGKLVAWVTSSQGASKPVVGAKVQMYLSKYNEVSTAVAPARFGWFLMHCCSEVAVCGSPVVAYARGVQAVVHPVCVC